uniref:Uncharacterized protein n=1 Tax=Chromera velia CCMP2878 TaxID=1169474 RepID=A0A0G4FQT0_9ALVE|mmetsp:Transcript_29507/g.57895  ORF Transcript_29507/g.57895 Transcript_29507/m.57895 type:complete len:165 (+) Transcript_29507:255-749(+)|eukprot:Cvel_18274.t1-p1 / transcript=Cvel_18274.t1 / gene=Cvel_18274 / organism=Chromera_velia_CCMP2878 / gene_product=UPF0587 protein CG4646, putative / transcript_product=UPF0587 protein CG4646, putative / location=Cvel_scaffold1505:31956-33674(-) / protein_length=164 / sequence_SO=supercontig / SO=protein_coding / is_pseudo=false
MPLIGLYVKADLENVESITIPADYQWLMDVKQSNGEETRENVTMNAQESYEMENSRGSANFLIKFPGSKSQASISIVTSSQKGVASEYPAQGTNPGDWQPVAVFECRGAEPCKWHPSKGFRIRTPKGTVFEDADLSEDWYEVCEKSSEPCQVENLEFEFRVFRG